MAEAGQLYLERRTNLRVPYHFTVRFVTDPNRPLRLTQALTQDICFRGIQILTSSVPNPKRPFDIWIPIDHDEIIHAKAKAQWTSIEDTFADSAYWVKSGLELSFDHPRNRQRLVEALEKKMNLERTRLQSDATKVSYIF